MRIRVHRRAVVAAGVLLCVAATGCSTAAAPSDGPVLKAPPGLEGLYGQQLAFGPCDEYATTDLDRSVFGKDALECARLRVPLDYDDPAGRTAELGVLRIAASGEPARDACEAWPAAPTLGSPYATDVDGLPRTLVVSVTGDPASPHEGGIALARTLEAGPLTVRGERHGAVLVAGNSCVDDAVAAYLISAEAPADARCTL